MIYRSKRKVMTEPTTAPARKTCTKCKETKPLTDFSKMTGSKDGRNYKCNACNCETSRAVRATWVAKKIPAQPDYIRKTCCECGATKPLSEFGPRVDSPDGKRGQCIRCRSAAIAEWRADNPDKMAILQARARVKTNARYANDPVFKAKRRATSVASKARRSPAAIARTKYNAKLNQLKKKYNLTIEQYTELANGQEGRCKICGRSDKKLAVDHCHVTGIVRGLLCRTCNSAIGLFQESLDNVKNAAVYLTAAQHKQENYSVEC